MAVLIAFGLSIVTWAIIFAVLVSLLTMYLLYRGLQEPYVPPSCPKRARKATASKTATSPLTTASTVTPLNLSGSSSLSSSGSSPSLETIPEVLVPELSVSSQASASARHHRRGPSKTFKVYTLCRNPSETDLLRSSNSGNSSNSSASTSSDSSPPSSRPPSPQRSRPPSPPRSCSGSYENTDLCSKVKRIMARSIDALPVYTDLPRLAHRVVLHDHDTDVLLAPPKSSSGLGWHRSLSWLVIELARRLETPEHASVIEAACHSAASADASEWTERLFQKLGANSRTASVLKSINQSVIMPVATELKMTFFNSTGQLTKDVASERGWEIVVDAQAARQHILVSHVRTEQSIAGDFEFRWRLKLDFDCSESNKATLHDVTLKVCEVSVHQNMAQDMKDKLLATVRSLTAADYR